MSAAFDNYKAALAAYVKAEQALAAMQKTIAAVEWSLRSKQSPFKRVVTGPAEETGPYVGSWPTGPDIQRCYEDFSAALSACKLAWEGIPAADKKMLALPPFLDSGKR